MTEIRIPLKGCTRLHVYRDGGVSAQKGLTSMHWIANGNWGDWIALPFVLVEAVWWLAFGS